MSFDRRLFKDGDAIVIGNGTSETFGEVYDPKPWRLDRKLGWFLTSGKKKSTLTCGDGGTYKVRVKK